MRCLATPTLAILGVLVCAALPPRLAWAQGLEEPQAPADMEAKARALYERGIRHYNLFEYDQAIEAFKEGYKLSGIPAFLFNIAQSYRLKGDCVQALLFYRNYLRSHPDAENRKIAEEKMAAMEECVRKAEAEKARAAEKPLGNVAPHTQKRTHLKVLGLLSLGMGLTLGGASVYFGLQARESSSKISDLYKAGGTWDRAAQDTERWGRLSQALMITLAASGAAFVTTGAVVTWYGFRPAEQPPRGRLAFVPSPTGGAVVCVGAF